MLLLEGMSNLTTLVSSIKNFAPPIVRPPMKKTYILNKPNN